MADGPHKDDVLVTLKQVELLSQVALEAIRLLSPRDERCSDCGLGGVGALRDALIKALGPSYQLLVWGYDQNIDLRAWNANLREAAEGELCK